MAYDNAEISEIKGKNMAKTNDATNIATSRNVTGSNTVSRKTPWDWTRPWNISAAARKESARAGVRSPQSISGIMLGGNCRWEARLSASERPVSTSSATRRFLSRERLGLCPLGELRR